MAKALIYHNIRCLVCKELEVTMVKVGPMIVCNKCFQKELVDKGLTIDCNSDINSGCKAYKTWSAIHREESCK